MSYGGEYGGSTLPPGPPPAARRWGNGPSRNALRNAVNVFRLRVPCVDEDGTQKGNVFDLLWSNIPCMVTPRMVDRVSATGAIVQVTAYGIMFGRNPGVQLGDQIQWADDLGAIVKISVTGGRNMSGRGSGFYVTGDQAKGL